jgi:hypothetical protein
MGAVLRFAEVKEIVRLIVRFVLALAAALVLIVAGMVAVQWVTFHGSTTESAGRFFASLMLGALPRALLPAVVVATLLCLFALLRLTTARPLGLLGVVLLSGFSITVGMNLVAGLPQTSQQASTDRGRRLEPETLYRAEPLDFYAVNRQGTQFEPVVVHHSERDPAFAVVSQAVQDARLGRLYLRGGEVGGEIDLSTVRNAYWQAFVPSPPVSGIFADVAAAGEMLRRTAEEAATRFLLLTWSLSLVLTSLWVLVRISRWPLLNITVVLTVVRGIFATFTAVQRETVREFAALVIPPQQLQYLLPGVFLLISIVLLLILVLLPPFHQWKREVSSG